VHIFEDIQENAEFLDLDKLNNIKYQEIEGHFEQKNGEQYLVFDFMNDEKGDIELLEAKY